MGRVEKTNVDFYELVNILGEVATNILVDSRLFAQGLLKSYPKKNSVQFETLLKEASAKLRNKELNCFQFLNMVTSSDHDNQLKDEIWGVEHSRIDLQPEVELAEEDLDSPDCEFVDSDAGVSDDSVSDNE